MEKEAVFEIREYVGDDGHEVVGHEVVDISGELEFFERMAKAQEMKEKEELAKKNANPAANGSSASSLPPAQPFSSNDEADFIRELSLLADQAEISKDEGDVMDVLERLDQRASKGKGAAGVSGWKKGFLSFR